MDFDARQVHMVVFITHHQVLVTIVPEKRVSLHLNDLVFRSRCLTFGVILEPVHMVELNGDNRTSLGVLDLEGAVEDADLQPVIAIKL